ncbi:hypothetical protein BH20ACT8_BH20ACT8_09150 [soil metagenome]
MGAYADSPMPDPEPVELEDEKILGTLNRHGVRYVVIGGYAAVLHGSILPTSDIDVTPETSVENLRRLAAALRSLGARLRVPGTTELFDVILDERTFRSFTTMTLRTDIGDLDVVLRPDAPGRTHFSYDDLARNAVVVEMPEPTPIASLDDIIASKEAAGREKDLLRLPDLYRLREALRGSAE